MIDIKSELKDYKKIDLDEIAASGQVLPENIRNSIVLYNKAIDSLTTRSEDIAMIELKKAVALNPQFFEALNLLGICYSHINDNEKATEIFNRVLKAESNGVKAQKYIDDMAANGQEAPKVVAPRKKAPASPSFSSLQSRAAAKKSSERSRNIKILKYVACFAAGMLLYWLLSLAVHNSAAGSQGSETSPATNPTTQQSDDKSKYEELEKNNKTLQSDLAEANKKANYYQSAIKLYEVESLASGNQYENAADLLISLKAVEFTGSESEKFNSLNADIMPKAALSAFNAGVDLYNTSKYQDALKKLEKVQLYDPAFKKSDVVLYYQGKSYQKLNDSKNAVTAFQKLVDTYPGSFYVRNAKARIAQLTQNP